MAYRARELSILYSGDVENINFLTYDTYFSAKLMQVQREQFSHENIQFLKSHILLRKAIVITQLFFSFSLASARLPRPALLSL